MECARQPVGESAVNFDRPGLLLLTLLLPALAALAIWLFARRRRRVADALGDPVLIERLGAADLRIFPWRRLTLLTLGAASLGFAAAGPRWGTRSAETSTRSLDLVVAVDVSKSMYATDIAPSRLEAERLLIRRLLRDLSGDRIGLVVFAGRAYTLSPLTVDHSALNLYVDALDPEIVSQGGSSLSDAITQATDLVRSSGETGGRRVVLLLSDGEAHEDAAAVEAAADRAGRAGVTIFTVGVGTASGAPIPELDPIGGQTSGYKRDEAGDVVISRMDPALLGRVARSTGGEFVRMDEPGATARIISALQRLDRVEGPAGRTIEQHERHALFIGIGLLLILIDTLLGSPALRQGLAESARQLRRRRTAHAIPLVLLMSLLSAGFGPGDLERGNRLYREGRYADAVEAYRRALSGGESSAELHYNMGTALLRLGRFDEAEENLRRALVGVEPELRRRSFYNLGNRFLEAARANGGAGAEPLLESAVEAYKRALRLRPGDDDAKWNLELALREQERQPPSQDSQNEQDQPSQPQDPDDRNQGGGGSGSQDPTQGDRPDSQGDPRDGGMSQEQADRILSAVEQDERDLTREKLRKGQRRTPVRRDW
jgi:Ca-activated chloride channel homolog